MVGKISNQHLGGVRGMIRKFLLVLWLLAALAFHLCMADLTGAWP